MRLRNEYWQHGHRIPVHRPSSATRGRTPAESCSEPCVQSDSAVHAACTDLYYTSDEPKRRDKTLSFCDNLIVFCTADGIRAGEPGWIVLYKAAGLHRDNPTEDADDTQDQEPPRFSKKPASKPAKSETLSTWNRVLRLSLNCIRFVSRVQHPEQSGPIRHCNLRRMRL